MKTRTFSILIVNDPPNHAYVMRRGGRPVRQFAWKKWGGKRSALRHCFRCIERMVCKPPKKARPTRPQEMETGTA